MDMNDVYKSEWMRHSDLTGDKTLTIIAVSSHEWEDGKAQIVLEFQETDQKLGLNKTNASMIADGLGYGSKKLEKTWVGKQVTVGPDKTTMGGKVVDCIRIRSKVAEELVEENIPF